MFFQKKIIEPKKVKNNIEVGQVFFNIKDRTLHELKRIYHWPDRPSRYCLGVGTKFLSDARKVTQLEEKERLHFDFIDLSGESASGHRGTLIRVDVRPDAFLEPIDVMGILDYRVYESNSNDYIPIGLIADVTREVLKRQRELSE